MAASQYNPLPNFVAAPTRLDQWGATSARRYQMVRAVPGYGLVMTAAQMDAASSTLNGYLIVAPKRTTIADVKFYD